MNYTAQNLIEMSDLRDQLINRVEVLSKVKQLFLIPELNMVTSKMVADFYEVDAHTLQVCYKRNKEEIDADGVLTMSSKQIREKAQDVTITKKSNNYMVFAKLENGEEVAIAPKAIYYSPRAVLRIGMLLRDSEVAKEVRTQLLNTFENSTAEQRTEAIDQEGIMLLSIIRAGSPELMAVELGKYRDFMNRHIAKLETKVEELSEANDNLEAELELLYKGAARWGNNDVARKLVCSTAGRRMISPGMVWNELYSNLYHACGMNLRSRRGGTILSRVKEDEWPNVLRQVALIAREAGVDIVRSIGELNVQEKAV